jgi:hypothetical protein
MLKGNKGGEIVFDLEQDLKELGYEVIWKQVLSYAFIEGQITVIAAVHPPTEISERWLGIIRFSGQGGSGAGGGFLYASNYNSREEACIVLMEAYKSVSIAPWPLMRGSSC